MIKTIFILALVAAALAAPSPKAEPEPINDVPELKPTLSEITPEKHLDKRQIIYPYSPYQYGYYPLRYGAAYPQEFIQPGGLSSYVQPIGGLSAYRSLLSYAHNYLL